MHNAVGKQVELLLNADSETDRERWLSALRPPAVLKYLFFNFIYPIFSRNSIWKLAKDRKILSCYLKLTSLQCTNPEEKIYADWDCPQAVAVHRYSPGQEDELPLEKGDLINILRKMPDGH